MSVMSVIAKFFAYARFVVVLVSRMVATLLHVGTCLFAERTRGLLGKPRVELSAGDEKLLDTENIDDAAEKDLADWASSADEDEWEAGGRDLLDNNGNQRREASESSTEDELLELSDGEVEPRSISPLQSSKRRDGSQLRHSSSPDKITNIADTSLLPSN